MATYRIEIETGNAAFCRDEDGADAPGPEIARILRDLADRIQDCETPHYLTRTLHDYNGNKVGTAELIRRRKCRIS